MMKTFAYRLPLYCYLYYDVCLIARPPTGPSLAEKEISQLEETGPLPETVHTRPGRGLSLRELTQTVSIQTGNNVMDRGNSKILKGGSLSGRGKTERSDRKLSVREGNE